MSTKLTHAFRFATAWHHDQMYGRFPYAFHLADVIRNLTEFHYDDKDMLIAGALHDILEDTECPANDITYLFGSKVTSLVLAVTGEGVNRKERKADTLKKLLEHPKAIPLKMADRLANIENCAKYNPRLLQMYKKEMPEYAEMFKDADQAMYYAMLEVLNKG